MGGYVSRGENPATREHQYRLVGVTITVAIAVYVLAAISFSFCFWNALSEGEPSAAATIRNLVLIWGAPLAMGLAVWRSMVARRQAEIAQGGLLSDRYQRAVEMLGHNLDSMRIGGIHALVDLAREHPDEYKRKVVNLLSVYKLEEPYIPAKERIHATLDDALLTILGPKKGTESLREFDQIRLRNSMRK